jgi:hypothetical protein
LYYYYYYYYRHHHHHRRRRRRRHLLLHLLLSLALQPSLGLGPLHKIQLNFLEASQQSSFLQGRVVSPTPNPHPGGPVLCVYIPHHYYLLLLLTSQE